jgi:hypothetical protein
VKGRRLVHLLAFLTAFLVVCVVGLLSLLHLLCAMFESELEPPDAMDDESALGERTVRTLENDRFDASRQS